MSTLTVVKLVHLLSMAVWIGGGLLPPLDARRSLALGKPHSEALLGRLALTGKVLLAAGLATLATGLWLILLKGGFKAVSPRVHAGFGLTLLIFILGPFTVAAVSRLRQAVAGDDQAGAAALGRRFALLASAEEVLRITVLGLMTSPD